jgi:probable HAF family extracellular repeat protein
MHTSHRVISISAFVLTFALAPSAWGAEFHGLSSPDLFGYLFGVSSDGAIAVGTRRHPGKDADHAVMWKDGVVTDLGTLGGRRSWAWKISADGRVIVGGSDDSSGNVLPVVWREGSMTPLQFRPGARDRRGNASGVSADGSVIVGSTALGSEQQAFRWVMKSPDAGVMTSLGISNGIGSEARDTSADGSVVVGMVDYPPRSATEHLAFRWVKDASGSASGGTMTLLRSAGTVNSGALATSSDGAIVVGFRENQSGQREAFRWERGVMTGLGALRRGDFFHSEAMAVSGNGRVVVGDAESESDTEALTLDPGGRHEKRTAMAGI